MSTLSNTLIPLAKDEELITRVIKKNTYPTPPFHSIGRAGERYYYDKNFGKKSVVKGKEVIYHLRDLPSCATWLFWTLVINRNLSTNVSYLKVSNLSSCEQNKLKKGYKFLKELQFIIRIKPECYLINPKVFIPSHETYPSIQQRWDNLVNP